MLSSRKWANAFASTLAVAWLSHCSSTNLAGEAAGKKKSEEQDSGSRGNKGRGNGQDGGDSDSGQDGGADMPGNDSGDANGEELPGSDDGEGGGIVDGTDATGSDGIGGGDSGSDQLSTDDSSISAKKDINCTGTNFSRQSQSHTQYFCQGGTVLIGKENHDHQGSYCCTAPVGMLLDSPHLANGAACADNEVATGYTVEGKTFTAQCQKINTAKFKLGATSLAGIVLKGKKSRAIPKYNGESFNDRTIVGGRICLCGKTGGASPVYERNFIMTEVRGCQVGTVGGANPGQDLNPSVCRQLELK